MPWRTFHSFLSLILHGSCFLFYFLLFPPCKELEHAKERGAKIYAEVRGYGMSGHISELFFR